MNRSISPASLLLVLLVAGCHTGSPSAQGPSPSIAASSDTVDLVVAATTDVHGRLRGWDYYANAPDSARGLTRAATIIDSVRAANPERVVLLDAGDLLQGNPLTYVAARVSADTTSPIVAAMNAMGYDAAAIGNHEYNYGIPLLDRAVAQARFPFLSANTYRTDGNRAYRAWTIVERVGVKVGIVGATTPGVAIWDRDNVRGKLDFRDIVPEVARAVAEVRRAGAQVVVVTVHSGLGEPASYDTVSTRVPSENVAARIAREVPGIDMVLFGHSHKELADSLIGTTLLVQPKNWATSVAIAHLKVARSARQAHVIGRHGAIVRAAGHAESPTVLAVTDRAHRETVAYANTAVGQTPVTWRADSARVTDTPLIDLILEVERHASGADLALTAAFSLDASIDSGPITVAELAALYPYDNTLRAVKISGRQLRDYLEFSARYYRAPSPTSGTGASSLVDPSVPGYNFDIVAGADYALDVSKPFGERVTKLLVRGQPVVDTDSFTLALNNYRQTGGGGYAMLHGAPVVYDKQQEIRQLLIDEVKRRGTIVPNDYFVRNWTLGPPSAVAQAYAEMRRAVGEGGTRAPDRARTSSAGARLRIIATNDFHGALEPRPDAAGVRRGGGAYVAAAAARAAQECAPNCETILLDGGDEFQGTPASNLAFGRPVVEMFRTMGYAASALGNHEFDWGIDSLRARMRQAPYHILGANVRYADGRDVDWIQDDTIVRRGALRVGIVGVATVETPRTTRAVNVAGMRFDDAARIVDEHARSLRARGADVVVVIAHAGAFCKGSAARGAAADQSPDCSGEIVDLANHVSEPIDAIVSGHTHSLVDAVVHGIPIVQARSRGQAIAVVDLDVAPRSTGADSLARRSHLVSATVHDILPDSLAPVAAVSAIVDSAVAAVAPLVNRPIGTFAAAMPKDSSALGDLLADAQRAAGKADVAVMNNGGIRAGIRAGVANYGSLFEVQPFANMLYKVTVSGAALQRYLENLVAGANPRVHVSGIRVDYDPDKPAGSRIVSAMLYGRGKLDPAQRYTIVMSDFMVTGGDGLGLASHGIATQPLNVDDLDALIDYVRTRPQPVHPPNDGPRLRAVRH